MNCSLPDGKPGNQEQEKAHLEKAQEFGYKPWLLKQLSPRPLTDQQHDVLLDGLAQRRPGFDEQLQLRVQVALFTSALSLKLSPVDPQLL